MKNILRLINILVLFVAFCLANSDEGALRGYLQTDLSKEQKLDKLAEITASTMTNIEERIKAQENYIHIQNQPENTIEEKKEPAMIIDIVKEGLGHLEYLVSGTQADNQDIEELFMEEEDEDVYEEDDEDEYDVEDERNERRLNTQSESVLVATCGCHDCVKSPEDYINRFYYGATGAYSVTCISSCLFGQIDSNKNYYELKNSIYLTKSKYDIVSIYGNDALLEFATYRGNSISLDKWGVLYGVSTEVLTDSPEPNYYINEYATIQFCLIRCADSILCNSIEIVENQYCKLKVNSLTSTSSIVKTINNSKLVYFHTSYYGDTSRTFHEVTYPMLQNLGYTPQYLNDFNNRNTSIVLRVLNGCEAYKNYDIILFQNTMINWFAYLWENFAISIPKSTQRQLIMNTLNQPYQYQLNTGCNINVWTTDMNTIIPDCDWLLHHGYNYNINHCFFTSIYLQALKSFCMIMNQPDLSTEHVDACAVSLQENYLNLITEPLSTMEIAQTVQIFQAFSVACLGLPPSNSFLGLTVSILDIHNIQYYYSQYVISNHVTQNQLKTNSNYYRIGR